MKKTTYILIALLAVLGLAAFVAPPLMLKRIATVITVMRRSDSTVTLTAGVMTTLEINVSEWYDMISLSDTTLKVRPTVEVTERPGLSAVRILSGADWSEQFRIDSIEGPGISVTLDFHGMKGKSDEATREQIRIAPDNMVMCRIEVPEGELRRIGADLPVKLIGLTGDSLTVNRTDGLTMHDCRVANVVF